MAITVEPGISGQQVTSTATYCYLYEPLRAFITEDDAAALRIYIDLEVYDIVDTTNLLISINKFATFDINPDRGLSVDLMKLARQYHRADVYNFAGLDDIVNVGFRSVTGDLYCFKIYSDRTASPTEVRKIPIIGGRPFSEFTPFVDQNNFTNEFQQFNVDLTNRWRAWPVLTTNLAIPTAQDAQAIIVDNVQASGKDVCGEFLIWKSKLGGWCFWGFDSKVERKKPKYTGDLGDEDFYGTLESLGNPYFKPNYTGITTSYSMTLKSLSLTSDELKAVSGINESPAVYIVKPQTFALELVRVSSATTPLNSQANGGDFTVSLETIGKLSQKTR